MTLTLTLRLDDIRVPGAAESGQSREARAETACRFIQTAMYRLGGTSAVAENGENVVVTWTPARGRDPLEDIAPLLNAGNFAEAQPLLELLLSHTPDDSDLLYNLGMVESDLGELDNAIGHLGRAVESRPSFANAWVALGVAQTRQNLNAAAVESFQHAAALEPDNPHALRNLGAVLLKLDRRAETLDPLRRAAELQPTDARAWFGLGRALELEGTLDAADDAYLRAIQTGEQSEAVEAAKSARSRLAQRTFRGKNEPRMDAVMYLLGAMERFDGMNRQQVQQITFEIAMLGRRGLDVNDSAQKYQLRSLQGRFSGLQLVCIEYAGFKILDPSVDIGFDLSREHELAGGLHERRKTTQ